jgi:hypothetical protein
MDDETKFDEYFILSQYAFSILLAQVAYRMVYNKQDTH